MKPAGAKRKRVSGRATVDAERLSATESKTTNRVRRRNGVDEWINSEFGKQ